MNKLQVKDTEISLYHTGTIDDYICITDIAKYKDERNPRFIIQNWMRNRNTVEYLGVWESLYNPNFNRVEFEAFRNQAGLNSFVLTPQKWIENTNAIGIISKAGRYGGTYAQKDIAFEFAAWKNSSTMEKRKSGQEGEYARLCQYGSVSVSAKFRKPKCCLYFTG